MFLQSLRRLAVPSTWKTEPRGWQLIPSSAIEATTELNVQKLFTFLNHAAQYNTLGQAMALAQEINCYPKVEWFYAELCVTVPPTPQGEMLACFLNDEERLRCALRNQSSGTEASGVSWSPALKRRLEQRSSEDFCWCLTDDTTKTQNFLQETYMQWHHRADYLVARKSREKREFRPDFSYMKVMQGGHERKRRMQQRKHKEEVREQEIKDKKISEWDNFTHDVLPRELREALDKESDGMEDVRLTRSGAALGAWRSQRNLPNWR